MTRAIGTDIIKIARFTEMTPHFMARVFTEGERAYLLKKSNPATAAGLFAAKEAVAKALGTGFRGFWPQDIEIWHDALGKPRVRLHHQADKRARKITGRARRGYRVQVSISHTDTDALAFALIAPARSCR
ncbi:MAG: holo-ACP synthase [Defluviitaleaceae bacterium]|nr:holo-ACP synthase [Defluviitaleaceae bacterium]MCL2239156.1 holo-ACP synthase [Defluviitaleaceae bacterium]